MRVLHLFSNWKWTGPAEHALTTARDLFDKSYTLTFACGKPPPAVEDSLAKRVQESGIPLESGLYLNKHFNVWHNTGDVFRLWNYINKHTVDLIHTHLLNDHFIAAMAVMCSSRKIALIRTLYDGTGEEVTTRDRLLISHATDGVITVSGMAQHTMQQHAAISPGKIWKICPGVDCKRFNPDIDGRAVRLRYGVGEHAPLVGIVARVQTHRRFAVFIRAIKLVAREIPGVKVFIIGRGTHIQEVAIQPVKDMGLTDNVVFTGYHLQGYTELLAALDLKVFLVPGSDGSCRAVREAMAMGKPVIVSRRGMLPEIVEDGVSGFVVDDTPENLAYAISALVKDHTLRKKMGEAARKRMSEEYNATIQNEKIENVYRQVMNKTRPGGGDDAVQLKNNEISPAR
jgi:glycosyltransferase involved in cell wall biosynthesis